MSKSTHVDRDSLSNASSIELLTKIFELIFSRTKITPKLGTFFIFFLQMILTTSETKFIGEFSVADPIAKKLNIYDPNYSSSKERSSEESEESPSTPRMKQDKDSSSKSTTSTYPHSTSNIKDDVKKNIEKTRELNAGKDELWAKFSENTEVTVVTKLEYLSSSDIGELSKWLREKAHPQINVLSISKSDIDDKAAKSLAKAIKPKSTLDKLTTLKLGHKLSKLATLELVGNTISDEGFKILAKVIQTNHTITTLNIDMEGSANSDQGIITLANAISTNHTITKLMIRVGKKMGADAIDAIAQMVGTNETFKELEFKGFGLKHGESKQITSASLENLKSKIESLVFT
jgi:hypothetical protein